jgi:transposase
MAMGRRRKRVRQEGLWTPTAALPVGASHPFYQRLNQILDEKKFDEYVEAICERFYADEVGRPGVAPGIYFRLLMVGYFEGIDSERGIAWRASDSLSIRSFVRVALDESVSDHSTISRTRRLMDVETHQAVFQWVLQVLAEKKLLKGSTIGVDATTLEANAALRSIVRRDSRGDACRLARGLGRHVNQHVWPQIEGLYGNFRDQAVHLVRQRLIGALIENGRQAWARTQAGVGWRLAAHYQSIPKRFSPQLGLFRGQRRLESLIRSLVELQRRVLGAGRG